MRRTLVALVVLVSLAGCTTPDPDPDTDPTPSSTPSSTSTAAPATPAPRPAKGLCYQLRYADAVASTTEVEPSSCKSEHTARTFFVGTVDAVVDGHLLAVDSRQVRGQIAATCPEQLARYLGGSEQTRRLSMLRAIWFSPSIDQSDEGQDWFRCDVIALATDEELAPLDGRLKGVLEGDVGADRFGMCGTADPEEADFQRVICSQTHSWEAVATIDAAGQDFPGSGQLGSHGKVACEDPARALAPDPLTVTWSYEAPTRQQWRAGQHYGICWMPES